MYIYIVHPAVYGSIKTCYAINTESERNVCILVCELWWVCETKQRRRVGEEDKNRMEMRMVGEGGGGLAGASSSMVLSLRRRPCTVYTHTHTHHTHTHTLTHTLHTTNHGGGGAYTDISHCTQTQQ